MVGLTNSDDEEFKITSDEIDHIKSALKDDQFRELLIEYANEISDPANKKKYEDEIIAMEKQRGQDVKFVKPQSGFVIKTCQLSDNKKVFINICTSPEVEVCTIKKGTKKGAAGSHISLPHSLTPCRDDLDKAGKPCFVCDVCFHPETYEKSLQDERFRQLLIDTAFDVLEKTCEMKVDRTNKKFPKMKYKGVPQPSIIRQTPNGKNNNNVHPYKEAKLDLHAHTDTKKDQNTKINKDTPTIPKYKIIHRGYFDMQDFTHSRENTSAIPKELVVEIELPLAKSANGIDLDIFDKQLVLDSKTPSYHLDISLPYKVNEDDGRAQFDKSRKLLFVTLPLNRDILQERFIVKPLVEEMKEKSPVGISDGDCLRKEEESDNQSEIMVDVDRKEDDNKTSVTGDSIGQLKSDVIKHETKVVTAHVNDGANPTSHDGSTIDGATKEVVNLETVHDENGRDNDVLKDVSEEVESSNEDIWFDATMLENLPGNSKLPSYHYDQTNDKVTVVVNVPNVTVAHVSLGFTNQQICLSFPQDTSDPLSKDWNMLIRLAGGNYIDTEECGFEIHEDCLELNLKKSENGIWEKIFIGVSEATLKEEIFMTENATMAMLNELENVSPSVEENDVRTLRLEGRLRQLLDQQDMTCNDECVTDKKEKDVVLLQENQKDNEEEVSSLQETRKESETGESNLSNQSDDETDDLSVQVNLLDLQDDVIDDSSPIVSPSCDNYMSDKSRLKTQRVYERSVSHRFMSNNHLRSILKRSKSDGASHDDTDEDYAYPRTRATTLSDDYLYKADKDKYGRRRNKSVTFMEEPIVFEFTKPSKRQWKRQQKEEKLRESLDKKVKEMLNLGRNPPTSSSDERRTAQETVKHGKKWKKKEKKRIRNNSESRSEEEHDVTDKKTRRKKKKKSTNENNPNSCPNSSGSEAQTPAKPSLNNPLIFQLD